MAHRFRLHATRVRVAAWSLLLLSVAPVAYAQSTAPCPEGFPRSADLGIRQLEGNFSIAIRRADSDPVVYRRVWRFFEEPRVAAIDPSGPSYGKLKDGDVLVAIDDALITTSEAGRKIGSLDPDRTVRLTVRRDGKTQDIKIKPRSRCPDDDLVQVYRARVRTPRPPRAPAAPQAPRAPQAEWTAAPPATPMVPMAPMTPLPRKLAANGWLGVGLDCGDCGWVKLKDSTAWRSNEFPTIYYVDPGSPAQKGGLQRGDVLTEINGVSLLSEEGGLLFGGVKPGQELKWTLRRDGDTKNVTVVAGVRPGALGEYATQMEQLRELGRIELNGLDEGELRKQMVQMQKALDATRMRTPGTQRLRYTGSVGNAEVTVKGQAHVQVTTDEETGEMVITTADATIRIKKSDLEKKGKK